MTAESLSPRNGGSVGLLLCCCWALVLQWNVLLAFTSCQCSLLTYIERDVLGPEDLFLFLSFPHKKYSRRLLNLYMSHCHMEYLNIFFNDFLGRQVLIPSAASDPPLRFNQKYLHLCSEDERRSYGVGTAYG